MVSGNAPARLVDLGICGWYSHASKERPRRPSSREAAAEARIGKSPAGGLVWEFRTSIARIPARRRGGCRGSASSRPMWASSTAPHALPSVRSAKLTMPAATRVGAAAAASRSSAATPLTNSVSPTGRIASGPSARYIDRHSTNTVAVTLCPLPVSARQLVEQVAPARVVPEMVVRVADGQRWLEDPPLHLRHPPVPVYWRCPRRHLDPTKRDAQAAQATDKTLQESRSAP